MPACYISHCKDETERYRPICLRHWQMVPWWVRVKLRWHFLMGREHWRLPNLDYLQTLAYAVIIGIQADGYDVPTYWRWMSTVTLKGNVDGVSKHGIVMEQTIHAWCDGESVLVTIPLHEWEVLPKGTTSIYALSLREEIMLRKLVRALGEVHCEHHRT